VVVTVRLYGHGYVDRIRPVGLARVHILKEKKCFLCDVTWQIKTR
jgi:hypothetical protein